MNLEELAHLVKRCRDAQRAYFRSRGCGELNISRDWERRLDLAVLEILNPPAPTLFDSETPREEGP